jgi:hypothetical protein
VCGLAYPYDWSGFVRSKNMTTRREPLSILFLYALSSPLVFLIRKYSLAGGEARLDPNKLTNHFRLGYQIALQNILKWFRKANLLRQASERRKKDRGRTRSRF